MNWSTIEDALHAWIVSGSGLAASRVIWSGQSGPRPADPWISMRVSTIRRIGHDWLNYADNPLELADDVIESIDAGANTATLTGHAYESGDGPVRVTTSGSLAGTGLAVDTDYWLIVTGANTVKFATSVADAYNGVAIDLTGSGTGAHTIVDTADTVRLGEEMQLVSRGGRVVTLSLQCFADAATGTLMSAALLEQVIAKYNLPSVHGALAAAGIGVLDFGQVAAIDGVLGTANRSQDSVPTFQPRALLDVRLHLAVEVSEFATPVESVEITNELTDDEFTVELE